MTTQIAEQLNAAIATVKETTASEERAEAGLASARDTVASLEAQLANAKFNLDQCVVYAPSDGFVTNWQVREGTMAVSLPFAPVGIFVDTTRTNLVATIGQNVCKNVKPGDLVEISFKTRPGEVFAGKVETVVPATGEGQFTTSDQLGSPSNIGSSGQFAVKFELDDEEFAHSLAMGTAGTVVIYTGKAIPDYQQGSRPHKCLDVLPEPVLSPYSEVTEFGTVWCQLVKSAHGLKKIYSIGSFRSMRSRFMRAVTIA